MLPVEAFVTVIKFFDWQKVGLITLIGSLEVILISRSAPEKALIT